MSSVKAVTSDLRFEAKIASFYQLSTEAKNELIEELSKTIHNIGKKHDFLTWRVMLVMEKDT